LEIRLAFRALKTLQGFCHPFNHVNVFMLDQASPLELFAGAAGTWIVLPGLLGHHLLSVGQLSTRGLVSFKSLLWFLRCDSIGAADDPGFSP
jgi:hypothetical protein